MKKKNDASYLLRRAWHIIRLLAVVFAIPLTVIAGLQLNRINRDLAGVYITITLVMPCFAWILNQACLSIEGKTFSDAIIDYLEQLQFRLWEAARPHEQRLCDNRLTPEQKAKILMTCQDVVRTNGIDADDLPMAIHRLGTLANMGVDITMLHVEMKRLDRELNRSDTPVTQIDFGALTDEQKVHNYTGTMKR